MDWAYCHVVATKVYHTFTRSHEGAKDRQRKSDERANPNGSLPASSGVVIGGLAETSPLGHSSPTHPAKRYVSVMIMACERASEGSLQQVGLLHASTGTGGMRAREDNAGGAPLNSW